MDKLNELKNLAAEIHDIETTLAVLDWDQQVNMPRAGGAGRASQISLLSKMAHESFVSDRMGELLESLQSSSSDLDPDSDDACLIRQFNKKYHKQKLVPSEFVSELSGLTARAHNIWEQAREESNFSLFQPTLEKIFNMKREYANFFAPYDHIYDPLLDDFEPGLKTSEVIDVFSKLREKQVDLIHRISQQKQQNDAFLHQGFDDDLQYDLGVKAVTACGFDWKRGRQDRAAHPFTTTFNLNDVRITTRIYPDYLMAGLSSTMHEGGHAMYEQGVSQSLNRSPLGTGCSLAIHESQSRFWENLIGRSRAYWEYFYPLTQQTFPHQLGNIKLENFYRGVNKVEPSLIRVDADEATYNLHIMLRLELEIAILEQRIEVKDLPEIWNAKMHEYLGVTPDSDANGVLQDVHWSAGIIGYFPTYALGNLISAQVKERMEQDIGEIYQYVRRGEFAPMREWLTEKIYRHGAKFDPGDLVRRVTGSGIDSAPYLRYLATKYGEIYSL
jgi:carboxypeptidase Taq